MIERSNDTKIKCDFCKSTIPMNYKNPPKCYICKKDVCAKCRYKLSRYIKNSNDTYDGYIKQICYICDGCINKPFPKIKELIK